jgi:hypothetical protein
MSPAPRNIAPAIKIGIEVVRSAYRAIIGAFRNHVNFSKGSGIGT